MSKKHHVVLFILWLMLALYPLVEGFSYYLTPMHDRPYMPLYEVFKPSGLIGQGLGIFGSLMIIIGVASYSARKRWSSLERLGKLRTWLTFHIFLCTLGPFLIVLHTTFKIGNIASIAFWSMTIVVISGIFGRYVYVHIPKTVHGVFLNEHDMVRQQEALITQVGEVTGLGRENVVRLVQHFHLAPARGFMDALWKSLRFDLSKGRFQRAIEAYLSEGDVPAAQRSIAAPLLLTSARLDQQRQISGPFQRLFGYWHVLHLPLAFVMLVTFLVHIGAAITFGYTWIF